MGLSFCEDDISVQSKKRHYRVDITPELFLKCNGRGCDDNRLVHAFAVQQHLSLIHISSSAALSR